MKMMHKKLSINRAITEASSYIFRRENKIFVNFFSNSEFGMRVYKGKMEARNEGIFLYTFLRISPRKINILKKTKLSPRELNEADKMRARKMLLNFMNILKAKLQKCRKMKKK